MSKKFFLPESEMCTQWYNAIPDIPGGLEPPRHPGTGQNLDPSELAIIFPEPLIEQEVSTQRWIDIPEEVNDILRLWRPTPLVRATNLERVIGAKARIYYKNEAVSPAGSHKPNSAVAQVYANKQVGIEKLATETGAGQWGSSLALACCVFGVECLVYMVKCSYEQKPFRRSMMQTWKGRAIPSPSDTTAAGRAVLADDPECPGSLGIAISEAVEIAAQNPDTNYALGSVLNHVLLHQTVIGLEARKQFAMAGESLPDVVVGCCGGGSNFAGIATPFLEEKLTGKKDIRFVAVEPAACPTMTRGHFAYDFGDLAGLTPLLKMHTLGSKFVPPGIHAGGLRYHGMAPIVSALIRDGLVEPLALHQNECFEAAVTFAQSEGIIPAPESSHAVRAAIIEARKPENTDKVVLFNLSGHGHFDMLSYDKYFSMQLEDFDLPQQHLDAAAQHLPANTA
ncbi:TrpB-like pyridoxal phosphate-dependent enzyme [Mucisphaera calidilacus]|uniref:Tryptophan synthase beta chain n=1 Tax=Mucisphaera calidilacus TaxID=2527982 RepID=A0A518C150_9BACT|nr:TrpB-like pyridoxal phosphate-dependent enzyme [Mucisphaera calidilacus]QDU72953.1 Tryptophan synthase beta chain [Mucisphaera calidilacus]